MRPQQIDILNSSYSTTRFAFTYAWWSAYGFSRHVKKNLAEAGEMELIDQEKVRFPLTAKNPGTIIAQRNRPIYCKMSLGVLSNSIQY